jgi:hypothetical protein
MIPAVYYDPIYTESVLILYYGFNSLPLLLTTARRVFILNYLLAYVVDAWIHAQVVPA